MKKSYTFDKEDKNKVTLLACSDCSITIYIFIGVIEKNIVKSIEKSELVARLTADGDNFKSNQLNIVTINLLNRYVSPTV